jgi:hypothetical protein
MAALPFPPSDPVWGKQGALRHLWRLRERRCGPLPKRLGWKSGRIHAYALLSEIRDQAVAGDVANPIPTLPSRKSSQSLVALQRFAGGDETSVLFYLLCLTHGDFSPTIERIDSELDWLVPHAMAKGWNLAAPGSISLRLLQFS